MKEFLQKCECYSSPTKYQMLQTYTDGNTTVGARHSCTTLARYEAAGLVIYRDMRLATDNPSMRKLSEIATPYMEALKTFMAKWFPEDRMLNLDVFNHKHFFKYAGAGTKRTQLKQKFASLIVKIRLAST